MWMISEVIFYLVSKDDNIRDIIIGGRIYMGNHNFGILCDQQMILYHTFLTTLGLLQNIFFDKMFF